MGIWERKGSLRRVAEEHAARSDQRKAGRKGVERFEQEILPRVQAFVKEGRAADIGLIGEEITIFNNLGKIRGIGKISDSVYSRFNRLLENGETPDINLVITDWANDHVRMLSREQRMGIRLLTESIERRLLDV